MTEEYGHISDAFDNLPEEELLMTKTERKVMEAFWNSHQQDRAYWHRDGVAAAIRAILNDFQYSDDSGYTYVNADDLKKLADELEAQ